MCYFYLRHVQRGGRTVCTDQTANNPKERGENRTETKWIKFESMLRTTLKVWATSKTSSEVGRK